jgi:hypothetical protein
MEKPMSDKTVNLPLRAKGKRTTFYKDPAVDQLFAIITMLTQELSVAFDRIETVERMLDKNGVISRADIEAYKPGEQEEGERTQRRDEYIGRVFNILHQEAASLRDS